MICLRTLLRGRTGCFYGVVSFLWLGAHALWGAEPVSARAQTSLVLVPVTVTDRNGKTLIDLQARHFQIHDDVEARPIVSFTREEAPASVLVVLDLSGSMIDKLRQAVAAVKEIASALEPADEAALLTFADGPTMLAGFTHDAASLAGKLQGVGARGGTALIDAVYMGLHQARAASNGRRALIVISDGSDNSSRYTQQELTAMALEADIQIYSISIVDNLTDRTQRYGGLLLEELSAVTGGLHFTVHHRGGLPEAASKISRALKSLYVIAYRPPASSQPGKWRRIRVTLDAELQRSARVTAKTGYYER